MAEAGTAAWTGPSARMTIDGDVDTEGADGKECVGMAVKAPGLDACGGRAASSASRAKGPNACSPSSSADGVGAGACVLCLSISPHSTQRRASISFATPQTRQTRRGRTVPQMLQNRAPISAS